MGTDWYSGRKAYCGDIHNHCGISYGHGPLAAALSNAALQLDFASITGHAAWPDMDEGDMPPEVASYHNEGFARLRDNADEYTRAIDQANKPGSFVTLAGYELHSFRYGDYTVLQKDSAAPMVLPPDGDAMLRFLRDTDAERDGLILMPHHIGYKTGFRGIDWSSYNPVASPLVEIISMHGLAESENRAFPYLHTMGPLDDANTAQAGMARGYSFGVTGSTDHHSAHPGSYGYGRTVVWAPALDRQSLWQAFLDRRTYAVSGDRIECRFSVNGEAMGGIARELPGGRTIRVGVRGGDALSRVEVIKNGVVWLQKNYTPLSASYQPERLRGKLYVELGWGEKGRVHEWNLRVALDHLSLVSLEPRLRGIDVVDPLDKTGDRFAFTSLEQPATGIVNLRTLTFGNATSVTAQTQGLCLEVEGPADGALEISVEGKIGATRRYTLGELSRSGSVFYLGGFLTPAVKVHRFVPESEYTDEFELTDTAGKPGDWYYLRVMQGNMQGAWTSPVFVR
ncbi:MAG: DUF3604 domain-containing protein [Spirochaetales bacterium]|nr:DUF3604 domain-containing protein [Spirochaetales bacterium]